MGKFWKALGKAVKATMVSFEPGPYSVNGRNVICSHCGESKFAEGTAQLNTAGMTFIGLDWANKSAYTLLCSNCGHIDWFLNKPEKI